MWQINFPNYFCLILPIVHYNFNEAFFNLSWSIKPCFESLLRPGLSITFRKRITSGYYFRSSLATRGYNLEPFTSNREFQKVQTYTSLSTAALSNNDKKLYTILQQKIGEIFLSYLRFKIFDGESTIFQFYFWQKNGLVANVFSK